MTQQLTLLDPLMSVGVSLCKNPNQTVASEKRTKERLNHFSTEMTNVLKIVPRISAKVNKTIASLLEYLDHLVQACLI